MLKITSATYENPSREFPQYTDFDGHMHVRCRGFAQFYADGKYRPKCMPKWNQRHKEM